MELTKSVRRSLLPPRVCSRSRRRRRKRAASLLRSSYSNCNLCFSVQNRTESEANNGYTGASDGRDATGLEAGHDPAGESRLLETSLPYSLRRNPPRSSHVFMGSTEIPSQSSEAIKIPTSHYEFGANFIDPQLILFGRIMTDGRLNARVKCDLSENLILKANAQLTNEQHMSHGMVNFDYKGADYRSQFQLGNGALFGASYIQSVTPHLSLGGEVFWAGQHRKSGIGYATRYNTDKMICSSTTLLLLLVAAAARRRCRSKVATGQVASTGTVALSYVQKVSEKVSMASDFMYNYMSRDVTASFGYDYILRQCRLRGKIDSNGCTSAFLEERLNMGLNFILSAEVDHRKKDYKFGFGLTVGE